MSPRNAVDTLGGLLAIVRDGERFYLDAAGRVEDAALAALFVRIAAAKSALMARLEETVHAAGGEPAGQGTLSGSLRQGYARLRAALGDRDHRYVVELEALEEHLQQAFEAVAADPRTPDAARDAVLRVLPDVRAAREVIHQRRRLMEHPPPAG
ncbi:PA2169 family four-helix-bundle protein [Flavobacterium sp. MXW15]|uniref:PA2169 family four-helix-bundle protein n=1 Tax=Xanthomonas chitinilytica TaxID=2989819 RepID=A0ABT3JST3_9XANT|nr:PA2169 family four-helix-bundle protein [Xanthomonas sp. H13-6]MCW4453705.1 PA2169 family four-helix-bundle protein [Flavobacterium sp. MXW15]MCW4471244.1 PA2169 family four-helix-bundle protein [Xanthomonas sp. H13-6]